MSQSSKEPTRDGSGAPAPAPPTGAVDHRAVLFRYFIGNENRFTGEALRRAASAAGYSDADIDAAWERSQVGVEDRAVTGRYRIWARLIVLALYLGIFSRGFARMVVVVAAAVTLVSCLWLQVVIG